MPQIAARIICRSLSTETMIYKWWCKRGQWDSPHPDRDRDRCQLQWSRVRFNLASCIDLTMAHYQLTIAIDTRVLSKLKSNGQIELLFVLLRQSALKGWQRYGKCLYISRYIIACLSILSRLRLLRCYAGNVNGYYANDVITYA